MNLQTKGNIKRIEKSYINDLQTILTDISTNYTLTYDGNIVEHDHLYERYIAPLLEIEKQYQCSALLVNGNRCSYKSLKETGFLYCKKHVFKKNKIATNQNVSIIEESNIMSISTKETLFNTDNLNETFINDKLYFLDEKFIYNDQYLKVGYIEKEHDEIQYILIDDPFILENL